jgi:DNA modification methylase
MIGEGKITKEELLMSFMGTFYDINQTDTLNTPFTRGKTKGIENSDKHICPFSIPLVNRLIRLYSNPGELVLDPFGGLGTTSKVAVELGRKTISLELKAEYFLKSCEIMEHTVKGLNAPKNLKLF